MAPSHVLALLAVASVGPCVAQIPPARAWNLTVYHLNPVSAGAVPVNMDTGDARGDLSFYLGEFLLPLECANASKEVRAHFDCDNPERVDPDLVVTKVDMLIDSRITSYSGCNLCNGTDPFSGRPCAKGSYVCDCLSSFHKGGPCDPKKVGIEDVKTAIGPHPIKPKCARALQQYCGDVKTLKTKCGLCVYWHRSELMKESCVSEDFFSFCPNAFGQCTDTSPEWMCWAENIPRKSGGYWLSTLAQGLCKTYSPEGSCSWKVLSTTSVKNTCLKEKLVTRVESASPECFVPCGPRNTNSSCWISCFFDTLLGPQARHSSSVRLGGLPIGDIEETWTGAFSPEEDGGCPLVDVPPFSTPSLEGLRETMIE